ncbi:Uncharacterized protein QTN25_002178 [Entamoeba marina]
MQFSSNRDTPEFDEIDSTPKNIDSNHLNLCFCPFCNKGVSMVNEMSKDNKIISWILLCRCILYSLTVLNTPKLYFSLKTDIYWFIVNHWYIFGTLSQFRTSPSKWKKSLLDALSHSSCFESGTASLKKTGLWKLTRLESPWDCPDQSSIEFSFSNNQLLPTSNPNPSLLQSGREIASNQLQHSNERIDNSHQKDVIKNHCIRAMTDENLTNQLNELKEIIKLTAIVMKEIESPNTDDTTSSVLLINPLRQDIF